MRESRDSERYNQRWHAGYFLFNVQRNDALAGLQMSAPSAGQKKGRSAWKVIPGLLISAFFLWWTFRDIHYSTFRAVRLADPKWILVGAAFLVVGYSLRVYRWWVMLQSSGRASFAECGRVLLTSFAANNVMPFRIGDFLRVFAYAGDLNASSSAILSTVVLERLLDVATLLSFLAVTLLTAPVGGASVVVFGRTVDIHFIAPPLAIVTLITLLFLFAGGVMQRTVQSGVKRLPKHGLVNKLDSAINMAFDTVTLMPLRGKLLVLASSIAAWLCEGMIFVSTAKLLGVASGPRGPWLALSLSNLSYLFPSSPGGLGTFELCAKVGMTSQGARPDVAALFGFLVHMVVLLSVTLAGGIAFLVHRSHRGDQRKPLLREMDELPAELPGQ